MSLHLHKVLYLYKTPSKFYIQPVEESSEALVIDRQTCEINLNSMFSVSLLPANATSSLIFGIIGIKHLLSCPYLIVITKASQVGAINGNPIYRMGQAEVIPFQDGLTQVKDGPTDWNLTYLTMLQHVLQMPNFYFSYTYDLTNSLQRSSEINQEKLINATQDKPHLYYDQRFLWNAHLMSDFDRIGDNANRYRIPFILGFVSINRVSLGYGLSWILLSRRSVRRAGTRFNSRGIDHDGNVANFVETEQIIEEPGTTRASFVQIRGSIPLLWTQKADYHYKPTIQVDPRYDHDLPMRKHFEELKTVYNRVSVINLIDNKGHEADLQREFSSRIEYMQKQYPITYHYFDFHRECSKSRWHRLSILMERIQYEVDSFGYFAEQANMLVSQQSGVVRSNCIDSLDRTNVVQSMIAQHVLERQLGIFKSVARGTRLEDHPDFIDVFKNTWADNADALSIQYAGTPALKTDYTRTGKRTNVGAIKDGINSLTRYVSNNFYDDFRQDAMDLFLGSYEGYPSPLYRPMDLVAYTSTIPVTIVMLTLVALYVYLRY